MGKDNQPKHRQIARDLRRRAAVRQPYERLLIVCEGEKTEPLYLREIQQAYRLATAHVHVIHSLIGTEPAQVLEYALNVFKEGDRTRGIRAKEFDRVVVVFDRDDHKTYHTALSDNGIPTPLDVVPTVPCFELWLLLHYENVNTPLHRNAAIEQLKTHLPRYEKGSGGHWAATQKYLALATSRAERLATESTAYDGTMPFTMMHELVARLVHLKD
jgi:hypothetical protein